jgi:hypothetical protein
MRAALAAIGALAVVLATLPAGANEATTISLDAVTANGSSLLIDGTLTLGADALEPFTLSADPQGDARVPAGGFDLGDSTVSFNFAPTQPRLVITQSLFGGAADSDGNPPGQGFSWPIQIDAGSSEPLWLAAGSKGTNFTPADNWWTGLCRVSADGWICDTPVPGAVTTDAITWEVPFNMLGAKSGRLLSASSAYGGTPRSFVWPSVLVTQSTAPTDSAAAPSPYVIPGQVEAGIAPTGTLPAQVPFTVQAPFAHKLGTYQLALAAPSSPGDYTVWVRSCWGLEDEPTCVVASQPVTL